MTHRRLATPLIDQRLTHLQPSVVAGLVTVGESKVVLLLLLIEVRCDEVQQVPRSQLRLQQEVQLSVV